MIDIAQTRSVIEEMRTRLLDLSGRNRLLNFQPTSTNCLRVVDELPDQLFRKLLSGKAFTFVPVPDPSEAEIVRWHEQRGGVPRASLDPATLARPKPEDWAQHLGIDVSYDLPLDQGDPLAERHEDARIQTLLYRSQLETRLRKLRSDATTAVQETGTNYLHLAFGFLDWREREGAGSKGSLAPLILVPAEIAQKRSADGRHVYELSWSGEDLQPNLSLQKKLRDEFGLELKDFGEDLLPERYFQSVRDLTRQREGWPVRRFATLSLFQFGKLLIYRDLDRQSWPDGAEPAGHPLVRHLTSGAAASGLRFEDPEPVDARALDLGLDLVERADSSQAQAIHAALAGASMVIQGPPGTGKSQTITNLIAGALSAGKTVLFVSEKLAALEVVRDRLDTLGLGAFVLELHSNKTRKAALVDDLRQRLEASASFAAPPGLQASLKGLAAERDRAQAIHAVLTARIGALQVPVSLALFEAGRLRAALQDLRKAGLTSEPAEMARLTEGERHAGRKALEDFIEAARPVFEAGESLEDHPFAGLSSARVLGAPDREEVLGLLGRWAAALSALIEGLGAVGEAFPIDVSPRRADAEALTAFCGRRGDVEHGLKTIERLGTLPDEIARRFELAERPAAERVLLAGSIMHLAARRPPAAGRFDAALLSDRDDEPRRIALLAEFAAAGDARRALGGSLRLDLALAKPEGRLAALAEVLGRGGLLRWFKPSFHAARREALPLLAGEGAGQAAAERLARAARLQEQERRLLSDGDLRRLAGRSVPATAGEAEGALQQLGPCRRWAEEVEACFGRSFSPDAGITRRLLAADGSDAADLAAAAQTPEGEAVRDLAARLGALRAQGVDLSKSSLPALVLAALGAGRWAEPLARMPAGALAALFEALRGLGALVAAESAAAALFAARTGLAANLWPHGGDDLPGLAGRAAAALQSPGRLSEWLEIDRRLRRIALPLAGQLVAAVAARRLAPDLAPAYFDFAVMDGLARSAMVEHPLLAELGRSEISDIRRRYAQCDERAMDLCAGAIAARLARRPVPEGTGGSHVSSLTELQLLKRETGKKTRHIPVRQLVARAGGALQALKPCFMMGPLSVAQYLQPGALRFDLVIFDEASQVRPEEALGALSRGAQAVIVGDSKQLPPTDFFQKTGDGDGDGAEDEAAIAADAESILEIAEMRLPTRLLRWHYRSRHPDLIAFSNHAFYKGELVLYPSPEQASADLGIRFTHVPDGVFADGTNPAEAEAVARAAIDHLRRYPADSLGVVAMNIRQRDLIVETLERLKGESGDALDAAEAHRSLQDRFFVKNLENVQGDERDGIIISMTYGPPRPGERVPQSFGPINRDNGWRRLNVLFSRARKRMHIVSSLREADVVPGEASRRGPKALKSFLHFAETGRLERAPPAPGPSGREAGSDFETAVTEGLTKEGFTCVPQVGSSGFFIDIGILDPRVPGRFLLGIECDGASYHSTLSARDRDRLRQEILEAKGWTIERVWSTDWFRDPDRELARLAARIREIADVAQRPAPERPAVPDPCPAPSGTAVTAVAEASVPPAPPGPRQLSLGLDRPAASAVAGEARERAGGAASPSGPLTQEEARRLLIALRERLAKGTPAFDRSGSVLRKSMVSELILKRPLDEEEFRQRVRPDLRLETKGSDLRDHGAEIFGILRRIA